MNKEMEDVYEGSYNPFSVRENTIEPFNWTLWNPEKGTTGK